VEAVVDAIAFGANVVDKEQFPVPVECSPKILNSLKGGTSVVNSDGDSYGSIFREGMKLGFDVGGAGPLHEGN
jgi:hypothetical protein